jgi:hypothetical protein
MLDASRKHRPLAQNSPKFVARISETDELNQFSHYFICDGGSNGDQTMNIVRSAQVGQGGPVRIACMNLSKADLGVPFDKLTATLQKCYDEFFLPIWGYLVTLYNTIKP